MKNIYLIGKNISYSLSPYIYQYLFNKFNCHNYKYEIIDITEQELASTILYLQYNKNCLGFNITIPYKEKITKYLINNKQQILKHNAINTVKIIDNQLYGFNTDILGLQDCFKLNNIISEHVLLFGTGGAAQSVALLLNKLKIKNVYIINRNNQNAQDFCNYFNKNVINTKFHYDLKNIFINNIDTIINTTPLGTLNMNFDIEYLKQFFNIPQNIKFNNNIIALDLIYRPAITFFMQLMHQQQNCKIINGLTMLISQAIYNFMIFSQVKLDNQFRINLIIEIQNYLCNLCRYL